MIILFCFKHSMGHWGFLLWHMVKSKEYKFVERVGTMKYILKWIYFLTKINLRSSCHLHGLHSLTFSFQGKTPLTAFIIKHRSMLFSEQQWNFFSWCVTAEDAISDVIKHRSQTCYSRLSLSQSLGICWVIAKKNLANPFGIRDASESTCWFGLFSLTALCTCGPFSFWSLVYL